MGCDCKNKTNVELSTDEKKSLFSSIKDYTIRIILFTILLPIIIPITIGVFFYVIVINKSNLDGFTLMKIIVKVLKNSLKNDYKQDNDENNEDNDEFDEDDYELEGIIY